METINRRREILNVRDTLDVFWVKVVLTKKKGGGEQRWSLQFKW